MDAFTIKDLENLSGIKAHTIRIWEQRYGFLKPKRTDTNIRLYSNDELKTVLNIVLLNKYGYKISHIDKMKPTEIVERVAELSDVQAAKERVINELLEYMIDLEMDMFERVLTNHIKTKGIERTVNQIIFPFLEKIGMLWQTGHINPAQEHLVTNIIRQKLMVGIETCIPPFTRRSTALLYLPEGEYHELGILFATYILKTKGVKTIYLGANVPVKDANYVIKLKKPDFVFVHLTATAPNFSFEKFVTNTCKEVPEVSLVVSGYLAQQYKKAVPQNVIIKRTLDEVLTYFATLV